MAVSATGRRGAIAFFVVFCVCLVVAAVVLNVGWVVQNWGRAVALFVGIPIFAAIITGLILNTIFLVREIKRNEQQDAFLNAVTHELKTPVTSIRLHLETLKARESAIPEARRREFYDVMLDDSDRLMQTIEQVLRTGQAGRVSTHRERVNLRALAEDCVALTRTRCHLTEAQLKLVPLGTDDRPPEAMGDPEELRVAILNLLDNAVKYSGENIQVQVDAMLVGDWAVVRVTDRGAGLPAGEQARIFKRFYRVPGSLTQRIKGTGLGLFIVHSTAKQHGGRAYAESAGIGRGSVFTLELPAVPPALA
jgi:two-component system, OmpR family, sensor histidine kinase SenX3